MVQDLYIIYLAGWVIDTTSQQGRKDLAACAKDLPKFKDGRKFAQFLKKHKLGKRVSNITNLLPELAEIAVNY